MQVPYGGTGLYRLRMPHELLMHKVRFVEYKAGDRVNYKDLIGDILVVCKANFLPILDLLPKLRKKGVKLVLDYDDYWVLPTDHLLYQSYKKWGTTKILTDALKEFDYITCTTELLADEIRKINKNVIVLENAINPALYQFANKPQKSNNVRFGWVGGHCHLSDIKLLDGVAYQLSQKHNDFTFNLFGHDGRKDSIYDQFAHHMGNRAMDKLNVYRSATADTYTKFYNIIDVALIPLVDNKFNSMKSELKLVEAAFFKKAVIVSDVMPYKKWLTPKNSLASGKKDWFRNANKLMENKNMISDLGEQLYEDLYPVFNLKTVNEKRVQFYESICK